MRVFLFLILLGCIAASGCIHKKATPPPAAKAPAPLAEAPVNAFATVPGETPPPQPIAPVSVETKPAPTPTSPQSIPPEQKITMPPRQPLTVTPDNPLVGKVATVNSAGRFVVLSFPVGHLPALEQRLIVNRRGLKVGEVKVTGPQQDENIVADIVAGDAETGDEVKDR